MTKQELDDVLRRAAESQRRSAERLATDPSSIRPTRACLVIDRLIEGLACEDFTAAEDDHVKSCKFCQDMILRLVGRRHLPAATPSESKH